MVATVGVISPQRLLQNCHAALVEWLGIGVPPLGNVRRARLFSGVATAGPSGPCIFSLMTSERL